MQPDKMEPYKIILEPVEIGCVPYMGLPECKECPEKSTTVIERRLYGDTGCVGVDTHLECVKLDLCKNVKRHLMERMQKQIICGDSDKEPTGLSRAEAFADE